MATTVQDLINMLNAVENKDSVVMINVEYGYGCLMQTPIDKSIRVTIDDYYPSDDEYADIIPAVCIWGVEDPTD